MKKIVFSLFLVGTLFLNINFVSANESTEKYNACMNSCDGDEATCIDYCIKNVVDSNFIAIEDCNDSCNGRESSCYTSCIEMFTNIACPENASASEKMNICINGCETITGKSTSFCRTSCMDVLDEYSYIADCEKTCYSSGYTAGSTEFNTCKNYCFEEYIYLTTEDMTQNEKMNVCMDSCNDMLMYSSEDCRNTCMTELGGYTDVINCTASCSHVGYQGSSTKFGCDANCLTKYLDITSISTDNSLYDYEKVDSCVDSCVDITGADTATCEPWCKNYLDSYSSTSGCMESCSHVGYEGSDTRVGCEKSCLTNYLKFNITSSTNKQKNYEVCTNSCEDILGLSSAECNSFCTTHLDTNVDDDVDIDDGNNNQNVNIYKKVQCGDIKIPYMFAIIVNTIVNIIKIAVPIIIVILGSVDLVKAVIAQKEDEIKKGQQVFIRRLVLGVSVFLVFFLVQLVIGVVAPRNSNRSIWNCVDCLVNKDCG